MASVPVDPILTWKNRPGRFAIVVKHVNRETSIQQGSHLQGTGIHRYPAGLNEEGNK
jgi:hypothetical protein